MKFSLSSLAIQFSLFCIIWLSSPSNITAQTQTNATRTAYRSGASDKFNRFDVNRSSNLLDIDVVIERPSELVLRIMNGEGKEVYHAGTTAIAPRYRTRIDMSAFPQGEYKMVIYTNDGRIVRNFTK